MKLSIITCTYNSEKYIGDCINSVLSQSLDKDIFEHIFVDGFSIDGTLDIIKEYIANNPELSIKILQREPKGIYNAMNEGIKASSGEYLLVLNSDDFLEPKALKEYLSFIDITGNLDIYYARFNAVNESGNKIIYNAPSRKIYQKGLNRLLLGFICYINQPATIHKRNLHEKHGFFNENLKLLSDWEFWIILSENKSTSKFYNKTVTNFRIHTNSATYDIKNIEKSSIETKMLLEKYFGIEKYLIKLANYLYKIAKIITR